MTQSVHIWQRSGRISSAALHPDGRKTRPQAYELAAALIRHC